MSSIKPSIATKKINQLMGMSSWNLENTYPINRQVLSDYDIASLVEEKVLPANKAHEILMQSKYDQLKYGKKLPFLSRVSLAEISTYMQNTLLRDTDQMSMAHALEVRVPFLDYQLVEYVLGIPDKLKYPSSPKRLLVDSLKDLLPAQIVNRPKMGFTLPWKAWLKNELYSYCEERLLRLGERPDFNGLIIKNLWYSFIQQDPLVSWSHIWYLVVLENWLEENGIE